MFNKCTVFKKMLIYFKIQKQNRTNSESIEGDPIIIEHIFTVVTTNDISLYDMINITFLNMMVSF